MRDVLRDMGDLERIAGKISPEERHSSRSGSVTHIGRTNTGDHSICLQDWTRSLLRACGKMDDLSYVAHAIATVLVDVPSRESQGRWGYSRGLQRGTR